VSREPEHKYFIAIIPPSPLREDLWALKVHFRDSYETKASLNSPPHITLHMPFQWKLKREAELIGGLEQFATGHYPFSIDMEHFGSFPPHVIFIKVKDNEQLLYLQDDLMRFCKREFELFNARYKDQPYLPHFTLAFRDLKKPMFRKAWGEFREKTFHRSFDVDRFALLKHNGKSWDVFHEFSLASEKG
jgi:2'-5' RNA ligase